ncbi:MAG: hypothetical protein IKN72_02295 [Clostridia bacterium]|nr:hypothetical protein [Clostridia bacterium]
MGSMRGLPHREGGRLTDAAPRLRTAQSRDSWCGGTHRVPGARGPRSAHVCGKDEP